MNNLVIPGEPSYLTSADPRGGLMYFHVTLLPSGSLSVLNASVDPGENKFDAVRYETSRKKLREEFELVARRSNARVGLAPTDYIGWRIHRDAERARAAGTELSPRVENELARVKDSSEAPAHPALALGPVADGEARLKAQDALFREPEIAVWVPPQRCITILNDRLQKHVVDLVKSRADSGETGDVLGEGSGDVFLRILNDSIDAFYDADERARLALKLRDLALVFHATRRRERALDALALADALEAKGEGAAHELTFLTLLQARAMSLLSTLYGSKRPK